MVPNVFVGCDISKATIDVSLRAANRSRRQKQFLNTVAGHSSLINWITRAGTIVRVVIEATGNYSLDFALTLEACSTVELMVANPSATRQFARAQMRRSKTDRVDADMLADFAERMDFVPWTPPEAAILELRGMSRRMQALTTERTRERARLHQAAATKTTSVIVINDIEVNIRHLERRLDVMLHQALRLIAMHGSMASAYELLTSIRGIAKKSAVMILPEILILPGGMSVRQWVAHAGLDPRKYASGSSVEKRERISKMGNVKLRRALYMPALVAIKWEPSIMAFYEHLIAKGKKPMVAIVAVMRKLVHAIYGMLKNETPFKGDKFYQIPVPTA
ncbi:MAG: IS110 family transposase [Bacteroidetes bacterium]|nr:IS110 family transposase [Bacteroidota bacterium]